MNLDYEPEHFGSMRDHLKTGDLTFDIGAYDATTSILIGDRVGSANVVIIEPAEANWPRIEQNWRDNGMPTPPRATFAGFMDEKNQHNPIVYMNKFPPESSGQMLSDDKLEFRWLHYRSVDTFVENLPKITIDSLSERIGSPAAITMDIEGAEYKALLGARKTLELVRPKVWVSTHPEFMKERFGDSEHELLQYMSWMGYAADLLKEDHENHWYFQPREENCAR